MLAISCQECIVTIVQLITTALTKIQKTFPIMQDMTVGYLLYFVTKVSSVRVWTVFARNKASVYLNIKLFRKYCSGLTGRLYSCTSIKYKVHLTFDQISAK